MSEEEFEVGTVRGSDGKFYVNVCSMTNDAVIKALDALIGDVKWRGIKVPALEKLGETAVEKYKASVTKAAEPPKVTLALDDAEMAMVETGRMIPAIKALRARVGCGLKEAKDACDAYKASYVSPGAPRW